jgi:hypothetical protein
MPGCRHPIAQAIVFTIFNYGYVSYLSYEKGI